MKLGRAPTTWRNFISPVRWPRRATPAKFCPLEDIPAFSTRRKSTALPNTAAAAGRCHGSRAGLRCERDARRRRTGAGPFRGGAELRGLDAPPVRRGEAQAPAGAGAPGTAAAGASAGAPRAGAAPGDARLAGAALLLAQAVARRRRRASTHPGDL